MPEQPAKPWYTVAEAAACLGMPEAVIQKYIDNGMLPMPSTYNRKTTVYHYTDIPFMEWILRNKERYTQEKNAAKSDAAE